jgi:hypothetical protein
MWPAGIAWSQDLLRWVMTLKRYDDRELSGWTSLTPVSFSTH